MDLDETEARRRFAAARVARLATVRSDGQPHLVPVTFAVEGEEIVIAVDHKPKRSTALQRIANIAANPRVSVLADAYSEDWADLWWVRASGHARTVAHGPIRDAAAQLLAAKYDKYRDRVPEGLAIIIQVRSWRGWAYSGPPE